MGNTLQLTLMKLSDGDRLLVQLLLMSMSVVPSPITTTLILHSVGLRCGQEYTGVLLVMVSVLHSPYHVLILYANKIFQKNSKNLLCVSVITGLDYWTHQTSLKCHFRCTTEAKHVYPAYYIAKFASLACWLSFLGSVEGKGHMHI